LRGAYREQASAFFKEAAPEIVVGVYRTYRETPPQVFYAHADHAQEAALIAMADSILQPQRGFPTLLDLAHIGCSPTFCTDVCTSVIQSAYSRHGRPLHYLAERQTRG